MKITHKINGLLWILVIVSIPGFSQITHYVNPSGNCGGNFPCYTTIHGAITDAVNGDIIEVDAGTYSYTTQLSVNKQVLLKAKEGLASKPVISINYSSYTSCALQIAADNVTVDGFEIIGVKTTGGRYLVGDYGSAKNNWTVKNCKIHESDQGIRLVGNNVTIEGNEIYQTLSDCINGEYGTCGGLIVTKNWLHSENTNSGRKPAGITYNCDATTTGDVEISYNYCHSCRTFIDFQHNGGIGPANNIVIMHNTVDWNMGALPSPVPSSAIAQQMSIAFWTSSGTWDASKFTIRDNIFTRQKWYFLVNTSGAAGPISGNMEMKNNLFHQWYLVDAYFPGNQYPQEWPSTRGAVGWATTDDDFIFTDNILSDPLYQSTGNTPDSYYALGLGSPAYNTATDGTNIGAWQSEIIWTGAVSTDWNTPGNWNTNTVPLAIDDVLIPVVTNLPVVDQPVSLPAVCNSMFIDPGSTVTVNSGKALTVQGNLTNNTGTTGLILKSDAIGTASFINETNGVQATVETWISPARWHFISSPIYNGLSGIFEDYYLQNHNEMTNLYTDIIPVTIPLNVMRGYALWTGISNTFNYSGNLNSGALNLGLTRNNLGWNLAGNPYPSSIDWDAASGWTKTNVNNAVYVENNGGWATYISGVGTNGGTRYIAPGQGFFVECNTHPGNLAMTDAVRVHNNTAFFKNEVSNLVRIEATGSEMTDETVIRFAETATADFDGMFDAYKLAGTGNIPEIYSFAGIRELSINALPSAETVQLGFRAPNSGTYSIAATEVLDIAIVRLEDKATGIFTDLTQANYSFDYTAGEDANRFVLHFTPMSVETSTEETFQVYSHGKTVYLNVKTEQADVSVFNLLGQVVKTTAVGSGSSSISMEESGIYLVRITTQGKSATMKVNIE